MKEQEKSQEEIQSEIDSLSPEALEKIKKDALEEQREKEIKEYYEGLKNQVPDAR